MQRSCVSAWKTSQRSSAGEEAGDAADVAGLVVGHLQRRLVAVRVDERPAGARARGEVVAGAAGERPGETVRRDREVHGVRAQPRERGVVRRGRERVGGGDDDVRAGDEVGERAGVASHDRALVPVRVGVEDAALGARPVVEERRLVPERVSLRRLDQHDVGAEVPEEARGERPGEAVGEVDDAEILERSRHRVAPRWWRRGMRAGAV